MLLHDPGFDPAAAQPGGYRLLPFRFTRVPGVVGRVLIVSDLGEYLFVDEGDFRALIDHRLTLGSALADDLEAKHFLCETAGPVPVRMMASKLRTKKCFLRGGPSLHEFVVTLRCDHACVYCQASRRPIGRAGFDMTPQTADLAVDRMFDSPAPCLTVEFQGGEPLLAFELVRRITLRTVERNRAERRTIGFTLVSTLHHLTDEMLAFFQEHQFVLCTSLDGPASLHDANRPRPGGAAWKATVAALARARAVLVPGRVTALTTLTRASLGMPEAIVDAYVALGFGSIFLRPISPYGFAARQSRECDYGPDEFLAFYEKALGRIIALNREGTRFDEAYAGILLSHILTPFSGNFVDLRSPCGAGIGTLVYHYDGSVYACDEGRMLAEMGDTTLRLGDVADSYPTLIRSDAVAITVNASLTEALPGCADCAYQPYCGECPAYALARFGDPVGHRPTSGHCARQKGLFEILFRYLAAEDPFVTRLFADWAVGHLGIAGSFPGVCR